MLITPIGPLLSEGVRLTLYEKFAGLQTGDWLPRAFPNDLKVYSVAAKEVIFKRQEQCI